MELVSIGLSNREVGKRLHISEGTIKFTCIISSRSARSTTERRSPIWAACVRRIPDENFIERSAASEPDRLRGILFGSVR